MQIDERPHADETGNYGRNNRTHVASSQEYKVLFSFVTIIKKRVSMS